jgi:rSAM/selenodomain-associated transferase 1
MDTLSLMEQVPKADLFVSYTPEGSESLFLGMMSDEQQLLLQRGDDFGARLYNALADLLGRGYQSAAIMDSDSPTLPVEYLQRAFSELALPGDRVVLGPAVDGGYYLIGIKQPHRRLFEGIVWSTSTVLAETLARAEEIGVPVSLLPEWFDVDDTPDFMRLCEELRSQPAASANGKVAPNTRRFINSRSVRGVHQGSRA